MGQIHVQVIVISQEMACVLDRCPKCGESLKPGENGRLYPNELEVLTRIGQGWSTAAIADQMFLSTKTVESHKRSLCLKLGLVTTREDGRVASVMLARIAMAMGLVRPLAIDNELH